MRQGRCTGRATVPDLTPLFHLSNRNERRDAAAENRMTLREVARKG